MSSPTPKDPWPEELETPPLDDGAFFELHDHAQLKLAAWRELQLIRAGVDVLDARLLAVRRDLDLHKMLTMLENGCIVRLLKEIVL